MFGKRVTDRQVRRYMDSRKDGHTQAASAARASKIRGQHDLDSIIA